MAAIAGIEIRRSRELSCMLVSVASCAAVKFEFEQRARALRDVTLRAFRTRMSTQQWIATRSMLLHSKCGRPPTLEGMAGRAFASARTFGELSVVRIGFMTIGTLIKWQRSLEVPVGMTLLTTDAGVLAFQRVPCFRVIKLLADSLQ